MAQARNTGIVAMTVVSIVTGTLFYWATIGREVAEVCRTDACQNAATRILASMNTSADPCTEFYQYACGGWIAANPIPDNKHTMNQFLVVTERNQERMRDILASDYSSDRPAIQKVKMLFQSCMDEENIERAGVRPVLKYIQKLGGMPLLGDGTGDSNFELESYLAKTKIMHTGPLIQMYVKPDDKNSSKPLIVFDQPSLVMVAREYYLVQALKPALDAYRQYMEDYLGELWKSKAEGGAYEGAIYNDTSLKNSVDEIIQLETELAQILEPEWKRQDVVAKYRKLTLKEMVKHVTDKFNWVKFAKKVMSRVGISVKPKTEVLSYGTTYFTKFMQVVEKYDNRVIRNYVVWMQLNLFLGILPKQYRDTQDGYRKAVLGQSEEAPRWSTCTATADALLPMPLSSLFVENMFSEASKNVMEEMMTNVLNFFKEGLPSIRWMDKQTSEAALEKVDAIAKLVGYPDYIMDENDPKLDEDYEDANVMKDKPLESIVDATRFYFDDILKSLEKPIDREEWALSPASVNAYYSPAQNLIGFPAAILQPPFFDPAYTYAMNYGAIGSVIGHELTHGFDTSGSLYDAEGNLVEWWSAFSRQRFQQKAQCVRDQFSGFFYELAGMFVNGNLTIAENIADLGGIRLGYGAYQNWKAEHGTKEFKLPGLTHFTPEQLYFIANGQIWCSLDRPENAKRQMATNPHSPSQFRVDGSLMNFDEFAKTFSCTQGQDALFPETDDTCRVW